MRKKILLITLIIILIIITGCTNKSDQVYEDTQYVLGTIVSVKIYDHGSEKLLNKIFDRVQEIEEKLSVNIDTSEVEAINNAAGEEPIKVSDETYYVIERGLEFSKLSNGKFDITMGPVVELWGIGTEHAAVPNDEELLKALELVNYNKVILNSKDKTVFLEDKNMKIDLGGIAKGYVADEITKILKDKGVKRAILNLGGNVYAYGEKKNKDPWKIGIQEPFAERNNYFGIVSIKDKTIVTSGPYERHFTYEGVDYHHIFDNKTGYPVENEVASVSVITKKSIDADALSTILFSMGIDKGLKLINGMDGYECIYVTHDKGVYLSDGIKENFELSDNEYTIRN